MDGGGVPERDPVLREACAKDRALRLDDGTQVWGLLLDGDFSSKPRSVEQFTSILTEILRGSPGHRVYLRDEIRESWLPYYVNSVTYEPEKRDSRRGYYTPPQCCVRLVYMDFGTRRSHTLTWDPSECLGRFPAEVLAEAKLCLETDELRTEYLEEHERYLGMVSRVGLQVLATHGVGTEDIDDATKSARYYYGSKGVKLAHQGHPNRCVIDVFAEGDERDRSGNVYLDRYFWRQKPGKVTLSDETEEDFYGELADDEDESAEEERREPEIEVPTHPILAVFDLGRHMRLRVHSTCVQLYEYRRDLAEKLVVPEEVRGLVDMLVAEQWTFEDIVGGKGGGCVVLCAGPPGVGKTLTAEVYSESTSRPLYSVQCSQLGTKPDALEKALMITFARAERWNAILLLDEADVYVSTRGSDLAQNAIVGVFLRVLEYYAGTLFFTTNRSDLVDDAIASRCTARIDYVLPSAEEQRRIWEVLCDVSGVKIGAKVLDRVVKEWPDMSGRDVKNLIKLSSMLSRRRGVSIDFDMIAFARRFKPTQDVLAKRRRIGPG